MPIIVTVFNTKPDWTIISKGKFLIFSNAQEDPELKISQKVDFTFMIFGSNLGPAIIDFVVVS